MITFSNLGKKVQEILIKFTKISVLKDLFVLLERFSTSSDGNKFEIEYEGRKSIYVVGR